MAIIGCYSIDIYCDVPDEKYEVHRWEASEERNDMPWDFTGKTRKGCKREALNAGWIIQDDGQCICPQHQTLGVLSVPAAPEKGASDENSKENDEKEI